MLAWRSEGQQAAIKSRIAAAWAVVRIVFNGMHPIVLHHESVLGGMPSSMTECQLVQKDVKTVKEDIQTPTHHIKLESAQFEHEICISAP